MSQIRLSTTCKIRAVWLLVCAVFVVVLVNTLVVAKGRDLLRFPHSTLLFGQGSGSLTLAMPSETRRLEIRPGLNDGFYAPSITADGKTIATARLESPVSRHGRPDRNVAVATYSVLNEKWTQYADAYMVGTVSISPDGSKLAYAGMDEYGGGPSQKLHVIELATRKDQVLFSWPEKVIESPISWSPDSRSLLYAAVARSGENWEEYFEVFDLVALKARVVMRSGEHSPWGAGAGRENLSYPAWSPSGEWIAYISAQAPATSTAPFQCLLIHPDGTGAHSVARGFYWYGPVWSPDSTKLLLNSPDDWDHGTVLISLVDIATKAAEVRARNTTRVIAWVNGD